MIYLKRIYEPYSKSDGCRVLVDRLWPRGVSKQNTHIDLWPKEITPSTELRKWFHHEREKYEEFKERYISELKQNENFIKDFVKQVKGKKITLLYAAKEPMINHAVVLKEYLENYL